jgi:hypothetical protein
MSMNISKDTVVTLHYKLSDAQGNLIEESSEPMVYLHGGYNNTLPKIEEALQAQEVRSLYLLWNHVFRDRPGRRPGALQWILTRQVLGGFGPF